MLPVLKPAVRLSLPMVYYGDEQRLAGQGCLSTRSDEGVELSDYCSLAARYRIGYVQPIGEKAIPGQVVDANSTANFGVGAFLLAACEMVRF